MRRRWKEGQWKREGGEMGRGQQGGGKGERGGDGEGEKKGQEGDFTDGYDGMPGWT